MSFHATVHLSRPDALFIGGAWVAPATSAKHTIISPFDGRTVIEIAEAKAEDVERAVAAAATAFENGPWPRMQLSERLAVLSRWADAIEARVGDIATAHSAQIGIPISFSTAVASSAVVSLRNTIEFAGAYRFEEDRPAQGGLARISREPVGVVAAIVPWNFPSLLAMNKMAPALAVGCPVIVKPALEAPLDCLIFAECAQQAGFPEGVLSVLPADRAVGEHLIGDPRVDKVSFTGSTTAGKHIAARCMERVARVTLELGGKSAAIILDDFPLASAIPALVQMSTLFNGQACMGLTRVLVSRRRHDELAQGLAAAYGALKVGDPSDPATQIGPVASPAQAERVAGYIEAGKRSGARLMTGGIVNGCLVQPTVFANITNQMSIAREEIFGPVLVVQPYDSVDEAVAIANDSPYGLNGAIFTLDADLALTLARRIRAGSVAQNGMGPQAGLPFGGYKQSGLGREGGPEALDLYTEIKAIYLSSPPIAPR
ncbi:aldehyde dehydrogenase [Caulobacter vibrioides]|jgi:aldehyde dehydrogenase (NAD+)|uniref:NAD-dependent aldehyde dehydrogenase n=1 Tax=Caulobacter vibrioides OR37 TaxID=1292034 RepID=R0EMB3_CAUVI|nr:aldehyde dehydrogenase [Caulobacter vibrioides]ENZ82192.1 NAD-dependent aldehyde dehydrogenase [Caulobacter vibrioides OR37]